MGACPRDAYLGTSDGGIAEADWINDRGQVVGWRLEGTRIHGFLWEPAYGMRDLGTLGGASSHANCINNKGQVVGGADTVDGTHPFLWEAGREMQDLGTLRHEDTYSHVRSGSTTTGLLSGLASKT